jgi:hypothetical protein
LTRFGVLCHRQALMLSHRAVLLAILDVISNVIRSLGPAIDLLAGWTVGLHQYLASAWAHAICRACIGTDAADLTPADLRLSALQNSLGAVRHI